MKMNFSESCRKDMSLVAGELGIEICALILIIAKDSFGYVCVQYEYFLRDCPLTEVLNGCVQ